MSDAPATAPRASNALLRRVVVIGTVLSLATAYGWMASFNRPAAGQTYIRWGWPTLIWSLIGATSSIYFWRKLWPPNDLPPASRKEIVIGSVVLLAPGVWWLTFPLRFLSGQHFRDVTIGLVAAALVLSFGAWMVIRLIKAFERSDTQDLADLKTAETGVQDNEAAKKGESTGA